MRSTLKFSLATPEADLEKIVKKEKDPQEGTSTAEPRNSDDFHCPPIETPIFFSHLTIIPSVGVYRTLNFWSAPVDFSPPGMGLEG
jgi:hypothetical protein